MFMNMIVTINPKKFSHLMVFTTLSKLKMKSLPCLTTVNVSDFKGFRQLKTSEGSILENVLSEINAYENFGFQCFFSLGCGGPTRFFCSVIDEATNALA